MKESVLLLPSNRVNMFETLYNVHLLDNKIDG